jgi:hypothetical protein
MSRATNAGSRTLKRKQRRSARPEYMYILVRSNQKRIRRPPTVDGLDVDEFIRRNADPIWLVQNEMWEYLETPPDAGDEAFDDPRRPPF